MQLSHRGTHETDEKTVDQTNVKERADLFRVHVLRGRRLNERLITRTIG